MAVFRVSNGFLAYCAVQSRRCISTFRRNILFPSSGPKRINHSQPHDYMAQQPKRSQSWLWLFLQTDVTP
jgi:hypothetical protein